MCGSDSSTHNCSSLISGNVNDKGSQPNGKYSSATKFCYLAEPIIMSLSLQFSFYAPWISELLTGIF